MILHCWFYMIYYFIFKKKRIKDIKCHLLTDVITHQYHDFMCNNYILSNDCTLGQVICLIMKQIVEKRECILAGGTTSYDEKMGVLCYYFFKQISNQHYTGWFLESWFLSNKLQRGCVDANYCGYFKEKFIWKEEELK